MSDSPPFVESLAALDGEVERLVGEGEALERAGLHAEARSLYERAVEAALRAPSSPQHALALRRLARLQRTMGELEPALALYGRAVQIAGEIGAWAEVVVAATGLGNVCTDQGRWDEAERHYGVALDETLRLGDRAQAARLWNNLSVVRRRRGDPDAALELSLRAAAVFEELGDRDELARCYNHVGLARLDRGEHERALDAFTGAAELAGDPYVLAAVHSNLCELSLQLQGVAERATEGAADRKAAPADAAGPASSSLAPGPEPVRLTRWGGLDPAQQAQLGTALAEWHGFHLLRAHLYRDLGTLAALRGDPAGRDFFECALEIVRRHAFAHAEADVHLEYGLFHRALGELEEARRKLRSALELYERAGASGEAARTKRLLGELEARVL